MLLCLGLRFTIAQVCVALFLRFGKVLLVYLAVLCMCVRKCVLCLSVLVYMLFSSCFLFLFRLVFAARWCKFYKRIPTHFVTKMGGLVSPCANLALSHRQLRWVRIYDEDPSDALLGAWPLEL